MKDPEYDTKPTGTKEKRPTVWKKVALCKNNSNS